MSATVIGYTHDGVVASISEIRYEREKVSGTFFGPDNLLAAWPDITKKVPDTFSVSISIQYRSSRPPMARMDTESTRASH
jgi:hypothetical protein